MNKNKLLIRDKANLGRPVFDDRQDDPQAEQELDALIHKTDRKNSVELKTAEGKEKESKTVSPQSEETSLPKVKKTNSKKISAPTLKSELTSSKSESPSDGFVKRNFNISNENMYKIKEAQMKLSFNGTKLTQDQILNRILSEYFSQL